MLAAERWQKIVELVNERGSIRVTELSELYGVTEETIRRDLDKLEGEGKLMRSHGGAVSVKESQPDIPVFVRETTNIEEKRSIARAAVSIIEPYDRIVLDASTTAWYMAGLMPDMPLTVLTNSIKVAMELSSKEKIEVISTGGILAASSLAFVGPLAERALDSYHVNKTFISSKGVHIERGVSESNELQGRVKQKMISIADQVILLADYSKFGTAAFTRVAEWSSIDKVITDSKTDAAWIERLEKMSVPVRQTKD
jgi:DeoR family transcriptional regulator, L-fucose operon activator